jgi:hypothetical protein
MRSFLVIFAALALLMGVIAAPAVVDSRDE